MQNEKIPNIEQITGNLTDWEKEPTVADLTQNITDAASDYDRHISDIKNWISNMFVEDVKTTGTQSTVTPKLIRKQAEWRYASLTEPFLSTPDLFNVSPITAGDKNRAKQNELVLNNQFNTKLQKVKFIDSYVRDAVDLGTTIVKVGWDSEEETITKEVPTYDYIPNDIPEQIQEYQMLLQMQQQKPEMYMDYSTPGLDNALDIFKKTGKAFIPKETGVELVTETVETKNQPTLNVYNHENLIIDPSCNGDPTKAGFMCEKFKTSLSELKKDGKYTNLDKINIEGASPLASSDYTEGVDNESFNFVDKARKQFVVHTYWGYWDIDGSGIAQAIVASWVGDVLIRLEENPYPDKRPPFVVVAYMPVRDSIFGEPDGELLESNQKIIGAVTRGMLDLLGKSANGQTGIRRDMLDTTNKRKFQRGDDYEFNATVDPRQGFFTHVYPEIPQSAYNMLNIQNAEAESLTGIKAFNSGISGQALGNTATGIRSALDASSKRELSILLRLAEGMVEIGHKIISMNAVFLSEEEIVRITDDNFIQIRRDDLAGHFDLRLSISTAEEDNKKAEELAFMLQTTGPNSDPGEVRMIRAEIARLRKMPDLALKIEEYQPEPDPMAQMEMELKLKLLQAQIAKEEAAAQKNMAAAQLDMARVNKETSQAELNLTKTGTEKAKARNLSSLSDKQDLDFVEQESGVNQERQLEQLSTKHNHKRVEQNDTADASMIAKLTEKSMETPVNQ